MTDHEPEVTVTGAGNWTPTAGRTRLTIVVDIPGQTDPAQEDAEKVADAVIRWDQGIHDGVEVVGAHWGGSPAAIIRRTPPAGRFHGTDDDFEPDDDDVTAAARVLRARGWRIVRTEDCANPDAGIGQCGCVDIRITEELTAAAMGER